MKRAVLFACAGFSVLALAVVGSTVAAPGGTGHTVTQTDNFHGSNSTTDTNPCTGNTIDLQQQSNIVQHVTFFPGGDEVWGTFTEEDKVTGTDEGTGVVYTGHSTVWGNFNVNEKNANNTFTSSANLSAVDENGVVHVEVGHEVAHVSWNAVDQAPTVSFDKMSFTCS